MTREDRSNIAGLIKRVGFVVLAVALVAINPTASLAQSAAGVEPPPSSDLAVPTTKLLAIGSFTAKATPNVWKLFLPSEVRETARLYLAGKIDQWYVKSIYLLLDVEPGGDQIASNAERGKRRQTAKPSRAAGLG